MWTFFFSSKYFSDKKCFLRGFHEEFRMKTTKSLNAFIELCFFLFSYEIHISLSIEWKLDLISKWQSSNEFVILWLMAEMKNCGNAVSSKKHFQWNFKIYRKTPLWCDDRHLQIDFTMDRCNYAWMHIYQALVNEFNFEILNLIKKSCCSFTFRVVICCLRETLSRCSRKRMSSCRVVKLNNWLQ